MQAKWMRAAVWPLVAALFVGFFVITMIGAPRAFAQNSCDALIVDEAGIFGSGTSKVEAAAQDLERSGAYVRVRTMKTVGSFGNLEVYAKQTAAQCSSWQGLSGGVKGNLVVFLIAMKEHDTLIFYGDRWAGAPLNDQQTDRIQEKVMGTRFGDGDFVGGFVSGIREVKRLVDLQASVSVGQPQQPVVIVQQKTEGKPANLSGLWMVLGSIVFAVVAIVVGAFLFRHARQRRVEMERRRAAQQKANIARKKVNGLIFPQLSDAVRRVEVKIEALKGVASDEDTRSLQENFEQASRTVDKVVLTYNSRAVESGLSEAEYANLEKEYQGLLEELKGVDTVIVQTEKEANDLEFAVSQASTKIDEVDASIKDVVERIDSVRQQGFNAASSEEFAENVRQTLDRARTAYREKRFMLVMTALKEAKDLCEKSVGAAEELPRKKQESEKAIAALPTRIEKVKSAIEEGRTVFDGIAAAYAESSWDNVAGNGTEAENRVNWALEVVDDAQEAATMEAQEWDKALEICKEANGWLDQAESFMRSVVALEGNLAQAKQAAPGEIAAAEADIRKAWDYIERYDADIRESREDELRGAEAVLQTAKAEYEQGKPDYLKVVELSQKANSSADRIFAEARSEKEAVDRLRATADSEILEAQAAVSKAEQYIEDHSYVVGMTAKNNLSEAQEYLQKAKAASDLQAKIDFAQKSEAEAKQAYSGACHNVSAAQTSYHESYTPSTVYTPTTVHHHYHRDTWGSPAPSPRRYSSPSPSPRPSSSPRIGGGGGHGSSTRFSSGGGRGHGSSTKW